MRKMILGIDAGGQSLKFALLDFETLELQGELEFLPLDSNGLAEDILGVFRMAIHKGMAHAQRLSSVVSSVAVSCPGPIDYFQGISLMEHKWRAIKGINIIDDLYAHGLSREIPVSFCHDAHSMIFGEIATGESGGYNSVGGIIIGTGLGFGVVKDGEMVADQRGIPTFGLFKRPFRDSTIEAYVASKGIPRLYDQVTEKANGLDAKQIGDLADKGDLAAIQTYQIMGKGIASVVAEIVDEYDIDCLVFGGRISNSFKVFSPSFASELSIRCKKVPYLYHSQGSEALSIKGAALYAKKTITKRG
jgi:glucokinase